MATDSTTAVELWAAKNSARLVAFEKANRSEIYSFWESMKSNEDEQGTNIYNCMDGLFGPQQQVRPQVDVLNPGAVGLS